MNQRPTTNCVCVTEGVTIEVQSRYVEEHSQPLLERYVFAYTVTIRNDGKQAVQLKSRHWIITDALGDVEEVKGPGVVGEEPMLNPGQGYRYTSGAALQTQHGQMRGTYQMHTLDGRVFDAQIAPFLLERPYSLN